MKISLRLLTQSVGCSEDELIGVLLVFNSSEDILAIVVPAKATQIGQIQHSNVTKVKSKIVYLNPRLK